MGDRATTHPTPEELAAFGLGKLAEADAAALEAHLAGCDECAKALDGPASDAFVEGLRRAAADDPTRVEPAIGHEAPTLTNAPAPPGPGGPAVPPELANHPRYRVLHELGAGGMGVVYKAEHLLMERPVALKLIGRRLTGDPAFVERFRREVRAAARLSHPNIVTAYDAEQAGELHFLVMEFVEGSSLDRLTAARGKWAAAEACDCARQAALGLQHAFERGTVHRDVKPQNLMRTPEGVVKVLDFGLARFAREGAAADPAGPAGPPGPGLTQTGSLLGTPDYVAPEQIADARAADTRADIYSLGCTLYYLLAGDVPFAGAGGPEKLLARVGATPRPLRELRPDVPPGLALVVERMMAEDPARRYQTPAEVADALAVYTTPEGVRLPPPETEADPRPVRPGRLRRALPAAALAAGAAVLLVALTRTGRRETLGEAMETLYTACAVAGGTLLACQLLLGLLGLGQHHDVGGGHDLGDGHDAGGHDGHDGGDDHAAYGARFAGMLTFRTAVAAVTFFGLAGRAAAAAEAAPAQSFLVALAAGSGAFFGVAYLMRSMFRLRADGTVRIERAVGLAGTVYLSVPGGRAGAGKVHLNLQNRTAEYRAVTAGGPLPSGSPVSVVAVVGPDTVEVIPAPAPRRASHV